MYRNLFFVGMMAVVAFPLSALSADNHAPVVSNVVASQRGDGSNLVDIRYSLADADGDNCTVFVMISNDGGTRWAIEAVSMSGDVGTGISPGTGKHVVWDVGTDAPGLIGDNFKARVVADDGRHPGMAYVSAGVFRCSTGTNVYLDGYWIGRYEVTNLEYCQFLNAGENDDHWHSSNVEIIRESVSGAYTYHPKSSYEQRPVRWVSWNDAKAYCDWLSQREGVAQGTYHVPSEAQWEKAAAWNPVNEIFWKYGFQSNTISSSKANYNDYIGRTTDVGNYSAWKSYYGCFDMSGNALEWCNDRWAEDAYPSSTSNPTGPSGGSYKVLRGGSWNSDAPACGSGYRLDYYPPSRVNDDGGFRVSRTSN